MADQLINLLLKHKSLTQHQIDMIADKVQIRLLKTDLYFSEAGKIANEVAFVTKGILRVCYYDKEGLEITRYFIEEGNFICDLNSYTHQIPSSEYIQAITDVQLLVFSRRDLVNLSATIEGWDRLTQELTTNAFLEKINRISPMLAEDATTRYINFLDKQPTLANRIPLGYLASYLGITPSSLSRIRRQLANPHFLPNDK